MKIVAGVVALVVATLLVVTLVGGTSLLGREREVKPGEAAAMVPALADPPDPGMPAPGVSSVDLDEFAERGDSFRLLAETELGTSWAAESRAGEVCLIHEGVGDAAPAVIGITCRPLATFFQSGASLGLTGAGGHGVVVHLLPADIDTDSVRARVADAAQQAGVNLSTSAVRAAGGTTLVSLSSKEMARLGTVRIPRPAADDFLLTRI